MACSRFFYPLCQSCIARRTRTAYQTADKKRSHVSTLSCWVSAKMQPLSHFIQMAWWLKCWTADSMDSIAAGLAPGHSVFELTTLGKLFTHVLLLSNSTIIWHRSLVMHHRRVLHPRLMSTLPIFYTLGWTDTPKGKPLSIIWAGFY